MGKIYGQNGEYSLVEGDTSKQRFENRYILDLRTKKDDVHENR